MLVESGYPIQHNPCRKTGGNCSATGSGLKDEAVKAATVIDNVQFAVVRLSERGNAADRCLEDPCA